MLSPLPSKKKKKEYYQVDQSRVLRSALPQHTAVHCNYCVDSTQKYKTAVMVTGVTPISLLMLSCGQFCPHHSATSSTQSFNTAVWRVIWELLWITYLSVGFEVHGEKAEQQGNPDCSLQDHSTSMYCIPFKFLSQYLYELEQMIPAFTFYKSHTTYWVVFIK